MNYSEIRDKLRHEDGSVLTPKEAEIINLNNANLQKNFNLIKEKYGDSMGLVDFIINKSFTDETK